MYILIVLITFVIWTAINSKYKLEDDIKSLPTVFSLILIFAVPFVTIWVFGLVYLFFWLKANFFDYDTNQKINIVLKELNIYDEFYKG